MQSSSSDGTYSILSSANREMTMSKSLSRPRLHSLWNEPIETTRLHRSEFEGGKGNGGISIDELIAKMSGGHVSAVFVSCSVDQ